MKDIVKVHFSGQEYIHYKGVDGFALVNSLLVFFLMLFLVNQLVKWFDR